MGEEGAGGAAEGAAAEDYGGDGAGGLRVGDAHEAAGFGFVRCHFGDEGDAHAGADHGEKAVEMAAFEDDVGIEARAIAGGDGGVAEAMAIAEEEEGIGAEIGEMHGRAAGEFVFFGERGEETFGEERMDIEFVAANGQGEDGKIDGADTEAVEKDGSDFFGDGELNFGKFTREGGEALRKPIGRDGGDGADNDGTGFGLQAFGDFVLGGGEFVEDRAGTWEKGLAEFGEADRAAKAVEEAATEFGFELEDLLGERGLRDVAFFGGSGEGAGVGDGAEVAKLVEFHGELVTSDG